jgi:hypothetical protein
VEVDMTFEELDRRYDNGFVDAEITSVTIDYQSRTATLQMNLRGNQAASPNKQKYDRAVLAVHGFYYFAIEPPDTDHLSYGKRSEITVDGFPEDPGRFPLFEHMKTTLPIGAFCCRFFVHDWNSFIHIAAPNAEFSWAAGTDV